MGHREIQLAAGSWRGTDVRRQTTGDRRQKTEDRRQVTEHLLWERLLVAIVSFNDLNDHMPNVKCQMINAK